MYVGETDNPLRRFTDHDRGILALLGVSQQPCYQVIRCFSTDPKQIHACLSDWFPFSAATGSSSRQQRRGEERIMIKNVGTLNPPKVLRILSIRREADAPKFFPSKRPLKRLRDGNGSNFVLDRPARHLVIVLDGPVRNYCLHGPLAVVMEVAIKAVH